MADTQQDNNESRPLLPRRNFGLGSWFGSRLWRLTGGRGVHRGGALDGDSSSPSQDSGSDIEGRLEHGAAVTGPNVERETLPPAPPNTPPEPNSEITRVEITEATQRPAESSSMGSQGTTMQQRFLLRHSNSDGSSSGHSSQEKLCLICLEPLLKEDFDSGEAMVLNCECKGDAALRHKTCAQKWVNTKGDLTCDVCRATITNLDAPRPRSDDGSHLNSEDPTDASRGHHPSATDIFDCIRMTWVVTIVCILFFDTDIASALVIGLLIAVMYTWSCQLLRCAQFQTESSNGHVQENTVPVAVAEPATEQQPVPAIVIV